MTWRWLSPEERAKRDGHILELWQMGCSFEEIATLHDLTKQRVGQIVRRFGAYRRGPYRKGGEAEDISSL